MGLGRDCTKYSAVEIKKEVVMRDGMYMDQQTFQPVS